MPVEKYVMKIDARVHRAAYDNPRCMRIFLCHNSIKKQYFSFATATEWNTYLLYTFTWVESCDKNSRRRHECPAHCFRLIVAGHFNVKSLGDALIKMAPQ